MARAVYDYTLERWLENPHSGRTPGSGAAAEPRHTHYAAPKRPAAVPELQAAGRVERLADFLADVLTVAAGLSVFGSIAYVFLVLA
jgi:hypothetical protein